MKKTFGLLILVLLSTVTLFAQNDGISIGGNVVFPVGDWAEYANIGYGASATYEHLFDPKIAGVLYLGYTYFAGDEEGNNWSMIPLLAGAKFYFTPKRDWYAVALLGVNFIDATRTNIQGEEYSASSTEFAINGNFGYEFKTSEKGALDISAGFVYINQQSYIGARLAYIFKL